MLRFLILFLLVWLALHLLDRGLRRLVASTSPSPPRRPSDAARGAPRRETRQGQAERGLLVACAGCGVRFPAPDPPRRGEPFYCSERCRAEHLHLESSEP